MGNVLILLDTTFAPITTIGEKAGICYGSNIYNLDKNYKRGIEVLKSHHDRCLEFVNVEMILSGYSARVIREWYTHIGGSPTRLQESTRYKDYEDFAYVVPPSIEKNYDAKVQYNFMMNEISCMMKDLQNMGIPKEDVSMLLPLGMKTKIVDKRNLRNLIEMSHQRLCQRAYWEYRQLMNDIIDALKEYSTEWKTLVQDFNIFCPKCDLTGKCIEKKGCGRYEQCKH